MSAITGRDYIVINGVSSETVGLYIDTPPMPPMQPRNFQNVVIPNRPETLTMQDVTRSDIQIDINAYLFDDEQSADPSEIYALIPAYQGHGKQLLTISFICSPYRYSTDNEASEITQLPSVVKNSGSIFCQPIYKLYGNGELTLTVNEDEENQLVIPDVDGYVIADAEKLLCYKDGTIVRCAGKIPFLNVGDNYIQTNATKIEIIKNERWL